MSSESGEPNIYCHLTRDVIDFDSEESRDQLTCYDRRALVASLEHDVVVVTSGDCQEEARFLFDRGVGPHPDNVLRDFSEIPEGSTIRPFSGTSMILRGMAAGRNSGVKAPPISICEQANDKTWFQEACGTHPKAYLPQGYVCGGDDEVLTAVKNLHGLGMDARIKGPDSASGQLQHVITIADAVGNEIMLPSELQGRNKYVVQADIHKDVDASVQFFVTAAGEVEIPIATGQHVRDDKYHYGNFHPWGLFDAHNTLSIRMHRKMLRAAKYIVELYRDKLQIFGSGSVDFVCDTVREMVWAIEVNFRVTAAFYAYMASRRWFNKSIKPFDMRSFAIPKGMPISVFEEVFGSLLFTRDKGTGFLPFCFLPEFGTSYGVCYARTSDDLKQLVHEVESRKAQLHNR